MVTGGIGVTIFLLEITVRFLPPAYPDGGNSAIDSQALICDNRLGWTGRENFHQVVESPEFRQELSFNSLGMHDTEHSLKKPPDTYRLLMLGDSFVQAIQVAETETSHQFLETYLNENAPSTLSGFEVISGAVGRWGTGQQLVYYREQGRRFQPDLVLLMFYIGNDFHDNLPGNGATLEGFNCYAPYFVLCDGQLNPASLTYAPGISDFKDNCSPTREILINMMGFLYQRSRLYQKLEPLLVASRPYPYFGESFLRPFYALYTTENEERLEQAWQLTLATINQLQYEVEADGAKFVVVVISPFPVVEIRRQPLEIQQTFLKENPVFALENADLPNRRLAEFFDLRNIPYIDLTNLLIEKQRSDNLPLYIYGDGHWTVEGNRFVAEVLSQWLVENNLLPK